MLLVTKVRRGCAKAWEGGTQAEWSCISHLMQTATLVAPRDVWDSVFFPSLFQMLSLSLQSREILRLDM